ncbi:OB-fold nucleic acid binding domain-containing protein [Tropicimonas sp. IMCC34011]|uniref:OB-fold nucleic acid binding domain-containing protein n=1 Tax=Tropicimonas sp. IMCC34011 TaxID=2248759 RepID=UPI000E280BC7|nr:OB-fold nucleic acid binding domain-containing protein [Tropicimonas sp. IMCC34011]
MPRPLPPPDAPPSKAAIGHPIHREKPLGNERWPRPPSACPARLLEIVPTGARITVAGLVLVRQRPGTAKGVIFITLEDETGTCNVVVWAKIYERFRRAVIAGRLLRVTGRVQRQTNIVHVVAEEIEDISPMLDLLLSPELTPDICRAGDQP